MSGAGRRTLYRGGWCYPWSSPAASSPAPSSPAPPGRRAAGDGPEVGSFLVVDGAFAWLGPDAAAERYLDSVDEVVPLGGALVTAAFVDAHAHLSQTGAVLRGVDLGGMPSLAAALARVEDGARARQGRPLLAPGWDEAPWPEGRPPTGAELDRASYGGVVYAPRVDGHSAVVSSALAAASGARLRPGWMGDGLVIGEAHHVAREAFNDSVTPGQRRADIELALQAAGAAGIGLVHENGGPVTSSADDFGDVLAAGERGDLPQTIGYWAERVESARQAREVATRHRAAGLAGDLNIDGSIGSRTAHLREPYADHPGHRGTAYLGTEEVREHVVACTLAGLQAGFHVIGDAGVDTAIAGIEGAAARLGAAAVRQTRHRLEHVEMVDAAGVARLAALGVVVSVQPAFDACWGAPGGMYDARLGPRRSAGMNPFASMLAAGLTMALGSDSPVTPFAPWEAIRACLLHHDADQRTSAEAAFRAHTAGGWAAAGVDRGARIEVGAPATFAVWDVAGPGLPDLGGGATAPRATRTVVHGRTVHDLALA